MIARTLALALGLVSAVAGSQVPEFAQQYRQRLGGAVDELKRVVERFDTDAGAAGLSRDEALRRFAESNDPFLRLRGISMAEAGERLGRLEEQMAAMRDAGAFARIVVLATGADADLAAGTYRAYEPAVPITVEGLAAGASSFVVGYGLFRLLASPFRRRRQRPADAV